MKDIVVSSGNEKALLDTAQKLGIKELMFFCGDKIAVERVNQINGYHGVKVSVCVESGAKLKAGFVIAKSSDKDRGLIENKKVQIIYDFELKGRKEFMNIRNSGMNQVIAKLMREKGVTYGVNLSTIISLEGASRAVFLGRMSQNLMLCRKYGVHVMPCSFASSPFEMRNLKDIEALLNVLSKKS